MARAFRSLVRYGVRHGLESRAGFSRRDFLKRSSRVGAAVALGSVLTADLACTNQAARDQSGRGKRFIIIGAGFAGLTCADTLRDAGADVVVLEAADRVGGRVFSDSSFIEDKTVELGGELVGTIHPTWFHYAKKFNLKMDPLGEYEGGEAILLDGKLLTESEIETLWEEWDAVTAQILEAAAPIDAERPWKSPGAADLDATSYLEAIKRFEMSDLTRRYMIAGTEADQGVTADKQSMLGYLSMVKGGQLERYFEESETHRCHGGNDRLAKAIAKKLRDRVNLKTEVKSIERTQDGVIVTTSGGATYQGDGVVLAIPPSVWDSISITPALDAKLKPQMGSNVKFIMAIKSPVWEEKNLSPDLESDGLVNYAWVSADAGKQGPPIGYTFFSGATDSEAMRKLSPQERPRQAVAAVKAAYPTLSDSIIKHRFMDWPAMPRAKASYSFPAPGQITAFGPTLVDGIAGDGLAPLQFAGEHTSYAFIGYMEGALSSGVRAARQLLTGQPETIA